VLHASGVRARAEYCDFRASGCPPKASSGALAITRVFAVICRDIRARDHGPAHPRKSRPCANIVCLVGDIARFSRTRTAAAISADQGPVPPARRLQHRSEGRDGPARARLRPGRLRPAHRDVLGGMADAHRARQAAAGPPESPAARRADQPPRPRGAQLARDGTCTTTRTPSSSSRTTATSSTRSSPASPRSTFGR